MAPLGTHLTAHAPSLGFTAFAACLRCPYSVHPLRSRPSHPGCCTPRATPVYVSGTCGTHPARLRLDQGA
eukprot:641382-Alexandrium_andersonii.AAC.1